MRIGSLFSGYGGLDMAVGGEVAWHVENDPATSRILDHHWPDVPNHGDVTTVDWAAVEPVDVLTGGFPCQDLSVAGKQAGLRPGTRSGLWSHMAYAVDQLRPQLVVIENVRGLLSGRTAESREVVSVGPRGGRKVGVTNRALGRVLGDLADLGYDARWCGLRAADIGAPHGRFRVFVAAYPRRVGGQVPAGWGFPAVAQPRGDGHTRGADVTLLKTPTAQLAVNGGSQHPDKRRGGGHGPTLADEVEHLPWGAYAPAIARWERALGRPAPSPTEVSEEWLRARARRLGRRDRRPVGMRGSLTQFARPRMVLSPAFVEWMMGLPEGHVTDPAIGLTRAQQLKALGNGVVPQQAAMALRMLLA